MVAEKQTVTLIWDEEGLVGGGDEVERLMSAEVDGTPVTWTEQVQVVCLLAWPERERQPLEQRLANAEAALQALTPPPGRGTTVSGRSGGLQTAVSQVLVRYDVTGLLQFTWRREEETITRSVGRGRGSPKRPVRTEVRAFCHHRSPAGRSSDSTPDISSGMVHSIDQPASGSDVAGPDGCPFPVWVVSGTRCSLGEGLSHRHPIVVCAAG